MNAKPYPINSPALTAIRKDCRRQGGFALAMVLLLLVAATLLAVVAVHQGAGQQQIAANQRAWTMAYAGAEFASRSAERWLFEFAENAGGAALSANAAAGGSVYGSGDSAANPSFAQFLRPRFWSTAGAKLVPEADFENDVDRTSQLAAQPAYMIEDLGRLRPPGAGSVNEGGASGNSGYEGSMGMSPAGNADLRVFRTIGKSPGPGSDATHAFVVTVWSIYAGRTQG